MHTQFAWRSNIRSIRACQQSQPETWYQNRAMRSRGAVVNYVNLIKWQYDGIFLRRILTTCTRRTLAEHEELIDRSSRIQLGQIVPYLLLMCTHYAKRTLSWQRRLVTRFDPSRESPITSLSFLWTEIIRWPTHASHLGRSC